MSDALARHGGAHVGLILKIETRAGFEALPDLLTEALLRDRPCGVMIARGDLAVEVGWERMAEVQEEILWLCEAARVPVVWATQVLDTAAITTLDGILERMETHRQKKTSLLRHLHAWSSEPEPEAEAPAQGAVRRR